MNGTRRLWWRFRRNPLRRRSDLIEGWLLLSTWLLAVVVAVVAGVLAADVVEDDVNRLRAQRHAVTAVLTEDAERSPSATEGTDMDQAWATVRWTGRDGKVRTGVARVEAGGKAGGRTEVWLDERERLVPEPATPEQAELQGTVLGMAAAVGAGALVAFAGWGGCARLGRRRLAQWDKEWADIDPRKGWKTG
ncbi:hypothetical protein [Streptomyces sp. RG80]|uniref:Rv1733c family protein n=1 Tax=Streptomyces sp. RG80 TaxID=3157340 RepID=UPI00338D977D